MAEIDEMLEKMQVDAELDVMEKDLEKRVHDANIHFNNERILLAMFRDKRQREDPEALKILVELVNGV